MYRAVAGFLTLAFALVVGGTVFASVSLSDARQAELTNFVIQDCGSCHGLTMKGGLGPALLPEQLTDRDNADLVDVILNGVPGTPMPPWSPELSKVEAYWIVDFLKRGAGE